MRVAIIFVSLLKNIVWCIPLNEFYPFGSTENDNVLPRSDDGSSPEVSLSSVFPFYDKNFQTLYVSSYVLYCSISQFCIRTWQKVNIQYNCLYALLVDL